MCMSNGVCAIRPIVRGAKVHQSTCLCRAGFQGDFCERQGKTGHEKRCPFLLAINCLGSLGSCSKDHCINGGICQQGQQASSRYRFCRCPASWAGSRCEKRSFLSLFGKVNEKKCLEYFKCQAMGLFVDQYLKKQGKYFSCAQRHDNGKTNTDLQAFISFLLSFLSKNTFSNTNRVPKDFSLISRQNCVFSQHYQRPNDPTGPTELDPLPPPSSSPSSECQNRLRKRSFDLSALQAERMFNE
jgi:hypothetical protein